MTTVDGLNPRTRRAAIARMRNERYDVVVIGGGVTGAGAALDATTRGLKVALVEKRDFAAGTSSRSGKLIHGGLRYLQQLNFRLVRESLRERKLILQTIAPHLTRPIEFLIPLKHRMWQRAYLGAALVLYDLIGGAGAVPRHRHLSRRETLRRSPGLSTDRVVGGLTFHDVQIDDARHTLELTRTASAEGTDVASALAVIGFERNGRSVVGVRVRDLLTGDEFPIRTDHVVNAAGVWSDGLQDLLGARATFQVQAAKGVHILVPRERIPSDVSLFLRAEDSILVARTWGRFWLIGTTDTAWSETLDHPATTRTDIEYILRNLNAALREPVTVDDIVGVYAGLRPLVKAQAGATSRLNREHAIETVVPGFTTISGGKYTTYRVMAEDVIDHVLGKERAGRSPSRTSTIPLLGARGYGDVRSAQRDRGLSLGLADATVTRMQSRYGALFGDLLDLVEARLDLGEPIAGGAGYLRVEAVYAVTQEGALDLEDVLARRTHISVESEDRGDLAATDVARLVAEELSWDAATVEAKVEGYRKRLRAERASHAELSDADASRVRNTVRDARVTAATLLTRQNSP